MRCLTCEYPLWDLKPGPCPECGEPFDPTNHEFRVGAVRFCCPHCDQAYYGDGEGGHLQPRSFDCVQCGTRIDEAECIVRPLEGGSREDVVTPGRVPWFDDSIGRFKRFLRTAGWSMTRPAALGEQLPETVGIASGLGFYALVQLAVVITTVVTYAVIFGLMLANLRGGGGPPGIAVAPAAIFSILMLMAGFGVAFLGFFVLGGIVHGVLRLGGTTRGGYGRTVAALGFGTGPLLLGAVPLLGTWCLGSVGGIWAIVSTILVLMGAQRVSGLRATLAVLAPVAVGVLLYIGFFALIILGNARPVGAGPAPAVFTMTSSTDVASAWVGVDPLPDVTAAAMQFPAVFDAEAETIDIAGTGYSGWCQRRVLVLRTADGTIIQATYDPITAGCSIRTATANGSGMSTTQPATVNDIHRSLQNEIGAAGGVPDLPLDIVERWVALSKAAPVEGE